MRKNAKLILCIILLLHTLITISQVPSIESQLSRTYVSCQDVQMNALQVVPELYKKAPVDSVIRAITFWEEKCGVTEASQRIKILVAIKNRNFSELLYDSTIIQHISNYQSIATLNPGDPAARYINPDYVKRLIDYNVFTKDLANQLLSVVDTTNLEYFFASLYANQPDAFRILDHPRFSNSVIVRNEKMVVTESRKFPVGHYSILSGIWLPTGNATLLGNHPFLGFQLGVKKAKNRFDLTMAFKFIKSANTYQIRRNSQMVDTRNFLGGYIGIDYAREISAGKNHMFELLGGAGMDGFDVYNSDNEEADQMKPLSIFSYNFNAGFQYSLFVNRKTYIGIQAKYNVINYHNKGGTNLSGHAIHAGLVLGFLYPERNYRPYSLRR